MRNAITILSLSILLVTIFIPAKAVTPLDFDGDGRSDFAVVRPIWEGDFGHRDWYISRSSDGGTIGVRFGLNHDPMLGILGDAHTPADFDGDNRIDIAIWRSSDQPSMSAYYVLKSSDGTVRVINFGQKGDDPGAVGDFDGDGIADPAVYRQSAQTRGKGSGFLFRRSLNNPTGITSFVGIGGSAYQRFPGDFDGDNKLDFCVYARTTGGFVLRRSSDLGAETINWAQPGGSPIPGDFDGDGRSDFAVVREVGIGWYWHILERDGGGTGSTPIQWGGLVADTNEMDMWMWPGDYDGDGKTDITITRNARDAGGVQGRKTFFVKKSSDGATLQFQWGLSGDYVLDAQ